MTLQVKQPKVNAITKYQMWSTGTNSIREAKGIILGDKALQRGNAA